ncbi:MAG: acyl-CoA dehydrogenase [Actinobacteria bacterium]|nr:acyl-CoA dehydrogenase [Actinomycetota bacterium]
MAVITTESVRGEVRAWLAESWDPDLTVGEWWDRLMRSGYGAPTFLEEDYGKGYNRALANVVNEELASAGVVGPPAGLGYLLAAPTIVAHATREQKDLWLPRIISGQDAWCQLFSEPGAGSDLAGLQCKAERDGDEWVITGQKVWTSTAQLCNMGMLIARTDPDAPKHAGISYFAFDMDQPAVEIRPLREMTGRAMFNEVFLDGARVPDWNLIGGLNNGWAVANTTLAAERAGLGSGGSGAAGSAFPGPLSNQLGERVGNTVGQVRTGGTGGGGGGMAQHLIKLARDNGTIDDPIVRQGISKLWSLQQIGKYSALRMKGGGASAGAPNIAKLMMSDMLRLHREVATQVLGPDVAIMGRDAKTGGLVQKAILFSPGPSIYGGTDQVQRNIIGERALGLPKEPDPNKGAPFKDIPRNA